MYTCSKVLSKTSLLLLVCFSLIHCGNNSGTDTIPVLSNKGGGKPFLTFKLNGRTLSGTKIFGAFNPKGYPPGTTVISGDFSKDGSEAFNIAVGGITGPGTYTFNNKSVPEISSIQYIDPNAKDPFSVRLLATNNKDGEQFKITITKASGLDLEGSFEGTLTSDNGLNVVHITEGKFDTE